MKPKVGSVILTGIRAECICCSKGFWGKLRNCTVCDNDGFVDYEFLYIVNSLSSAYVKLSINGHCTDFEPMSLKLLTGLNTVLNVTKSYDYSKNRLTVESGYGKIIFQLDKDTGNFSTVRREVKV